ncbi:MAG: signal peptidase I [Micavibrio sp.]|nr:signal peptidase I [Micavibrio sp.]
MQEDTNDAETILSAQKSKTAKKSAKINEKEEISELAKTVIIALLLALVIRTFLYEPFNIPSGSMLPTLKVGDYLFVSKTAYGYSRHSFPFGMASFDGRVMDGVESNKPKRGDVAVFKLPTNTSVDYIKRIVGLPGERVQVIAGRLYIDGERVEREVVGLHQEVGSNYRNHTVTEYLETLPGGIVHRIYEVSDNENLDNTKEYIVPEGHYFMMGDNRDNSQDSRVQSLVGYVPYENFVGRADILFFSIDDKAKLFLPWTWFKAVRFNRIFDKISPVRPEGT